MNYNNKDNELKKYVQNILQIEEQIRRDDFNAVTNRHQLGQSALGIKNRLKKNSKKTFKEFITIKIPNLSFWYIQKCMRIAENVDSDKYPALLSLSINNLLDLMCNKNNKNVAFILRKSKIKIPKTTTEDVIIQFRKAVNDFLYAKKKSSTPKASLKNKSSERDKTVPVRSESEKKSDSKPVKDPAKMDKDLLRKKYPIKIKFISKWSRQVIKHEIYSSFDDETLNQLKTLRTRLAAIINHMEGE